MEEKNGTESLENQLVELKEWVSHQPHIPKDIEDKILKRFLHSCYYDMGKAQKTLELFINTRTSTPELFSDRDPMSPYIQKAYKCVNLAQIPISGNRILWIAQINDPGLNNFDHGVFLRSMTAGLDAWLLEENILQEGDVILFDAKDISWNIFWKLNLSLEKKMNKYQEECVPIRIKEIHLVNVPSFIGKLFAIVKQFMSKEMIEKIHFHAPNSDTLFEHFSKDELPKDLRGNLDSVEIYNQTTMNVIYKYREVLLRDDLWKSPAK